MSDEADQNSYDLNAAGAVALAAGIVAVGTLGLEILTARWHARMIAIGLPYLSMILGVGTPILAAIAARSSPKSALPAAILAVLYWSILGAASL